jgi:glycerol-3-phosphate dehydrogenase
LKLNKTGSREEKLGREYDLVVIGGGVHGACAFEEAAARGINVLLLERDDFCSGASANSLKTIHGGIRYLQSGDIRRLRLTSKARGLWAARAPRLIRPLPCVAPLPRKFVASAPFVRLGALAYQLLTINHRRAETPGLQLESPGIVSRDQYKELALPFCDHQAKHGLQWEDYQVSDSERLVMDTIRLGEQYGGRAINYVEAFDTVTRKSAVSEVVVGNRISGRQHRIQTQSTIAFTGSAPGDSEFLVNTGGSRSRPVLAVNVVIKRCLVNRGVAFNAVAGNRSRGDRYLFCVPWKGSTILGTWYWRIPDSADLTSEPHRLADLAEVLRDINNSLDGAHIIGAGYPAIGTRRAIQRRVC